MNNFNDTNFEDYIRRADPVKREILVNNEFDSFYSDYQIENEYEKAIEESLLEAEKFDLEQINLLSQINQQIKFEREQQFSNIYMLLHKVAKIDKNTKDIFEMIEPIIKNYIDGVIQKCELDKETHTIVFKILNSLRLTKLDKELLEKILICY
jgi:hypothetical protein